MVGVGQRDTIEPFAAERLYVLSGVLVDRLIHTADGGRVVSMWNALLMSCPFGLLRALSTPMGWPSQRFNGIAIISMVLYPVVSSMPEKWRVSRATLPMMAGSPDLKTAPATPRSQGMAVPRNCSAFSPMT